MADRRSVELRSHGSQEEVSEEVLGLDARSCALVAEAVVEEGGDSTVPQVDSRRRGSYVKAAPLLDSCSRVVSQVGSFVLAFDIQHRDSPYSCVAPEQDSYWEDVAQAVGFVLEVETQVLDSSLYAAPGQDQHLCSEFGCRNEPEVQLEGCS